MNRRWGQAIGLVTVAASAIGLALCTQAQQQNHDGYKDTPMLPGGKWHVHDPDRPQPRVVDPGTASAQDMPGKPPADAVVLFDGKDLAHWRGDRGEARWKVENGYMEVAPGTGSISSTDQFGDCQLHIEFMEPSPGRGRGQGRGNSGVFLMGQYETQVLDSYENPTYADGSCGSIYGQYPPLVNASRKPGEWQSFDIFWEAPRFKDGKVATPAYETVIHNGVLVQNHAELLGQTNHRVLAHYTPHAEKGPIGLQDHGMRVRFRNIWVRPLKGYDEQ